MGVDPDRSLGPTEPDRLSQDKLDEYCAPLVRDTEAAKDNISRGRYEYAYRIVSNLIAPKINEIAHHLSYLVIIMYLNHTGLTGKEIGEPTIWFTLS